jgi:predicted tellurium resistance membrane protein TerC
MIDFLTSGSAIIALLVLTALGVIIGVDNIRFIDIVTDKLSVKKKNNAINISVLFAFLLRFILLLLLYWVLTLTVSFWDINLSFLRAELSGESLLLIIGGLFLIYKGTTEIHEEVEDRGYDVRKITTAQSDSFGKSILQSSVINAVFAFDVVLLALGLTNRLDHNVARVIALIAISMSLSLLILIIFKDSLQRIFKKHPSINILGLGLLILVGFAMLVEGAYLSHFHLFGSDVGLLPKNYIYIAIIISLLFMFLVVKFRKENSEGELTN